MSFFLAAVNLSQQSGQGINFNRNGQGTETILNGGLLFAPFIIVNGTPDQILDNNSSNDPAVYFAYMGANSDRFDHIRLLGNNTFGFEDLPNGGDRDYNDIVFQANFTVV